MNDLAIGPPLVYRSGLGRRRLAIKDKDRCNLGRSQPDEETSNDGHWCECGAAGAIQETRAIYTPTFAGVVGEVNHLFDMWQFPFNISVEAFDSHGCFGSWWPPPASHFVGEE
jgi:hypothetical protein